MLGLGRQWDSAHLPGYDPGHPTEPPQKQPSLHFGSHLAGARTSCFLTAQTCWACLASWKYNSQYVYLMEMFQINYIHTYAQNAWSGSAMRFCTPSWLRSGTSNGTTAGAAFSSLWQSPCRGQNKLLLNTPCRTNMLSVFSVLEIQQQICYLMEMLQINYIHTYAQNAWSGSAMRFCTPSWLRSGTSNGTTAGAAFSSLWQSPCRGQNKLLLNTPCRTNMLSVFSVLEIQQQICYLMEMLQINYIHTYAQNAWSGSAMRFCTPSWLRSGTSNGTTAGAAFSSLWQSPCRGQNKLLLNTPCRTNMFSTFSVLEI